MTSPDLESSVSDSRSSSSAFNKKVVKTQLIQCIK